MHRCQSRVTSRHAKGQPCRSSQCSHLELHSGYKIIPLCSAARNSTPSAAACKGDAALPCISIELCALSSSACLKHLPAQVSRVSFSIFKCHRVPNPRSQLQKTFCRQARSSQALFAVIFHSNSQRENDEMIEALRRSSLTQFNYH